MFSMEKGAPHCKLAVVKAMVSAGQVRTTKTAREGATALGFDFDGKLAVIHGTYHGRFSQEYDDAHGSSGVAGRVPPNHIGRRGISQADGD